ncbi:M48 family metalloprotease [Labrys monachus]|uniref:Zn-dependent protease n=1 Tax=Labrys monachus TaxID=217067 RepID=A0ABU0F7M1_9HYPH|nr:M48 family metalloprotease [Labrys monachus]MDQ0390608.1 putative Zn-dependent protease [Labrys monachus]
MSKGGVWLRLGVLMVGLGLSSCASVGDNDPLPSPSVKATPVSLPVGAPRVIAPPTADDRESDRLLAAYGGAYRNAGLDRYLDDLVQRLAAQSDRPDIPYRLTVLNASSINAFALPSGRLYVTRGLLALANDDAEIAAVVAHEMAHVSARHALARANLERKSQLVSSVMTDVLHNTAGASASEQRAQISLASFSRQQELDADQIGIRTIAKAGFDPYGAVRFLTSMRRQVEARTRPATPDFLSTHPSTPERIDKANQEAQAFGPPGAGEHDRYRYLSVIDGLTYGEDPGQGYTQGRIFWQPRLGFTFTAPANFTLDNTPQAILGIDGNGRALRLDTVKPKEGQSLSAYLGSGWITGVDTGSITTVTINGSEAATGLARGQDWSFRLYAIRFDGDVYRLILAARTLDAPTDALFQETANSFRRMTAEEQRNVHPEHIDIVTVRAGDTLQSLSSRMVEPQDQLDHFLVLNGLDAGAQLKPGDRVKIVSQ